MQTLDFIALLRIFSVASCMIFFVNRMALVCRYPFALNKIQIYSDINFYRIILEDSANASGNRIHFVFTSFFSFFSVNEMRVVT